VDDAGDAELLLGGLDPPRELDVVVGGELAYLWGADVGGGDEERQGRLGGWSDELAEDLGADVDGLRRVRVGVEGGDLEGWRGWGSGREMRVSVPVSVCRSR
jgi:hypothetical protein